MKNNHKHIIRMAALAILGVAMTACSAVDAEQDAVQTKGQTVVLKGQLAPKGGDVATRAFGWGNTGGYAYWKGGEEVAVYYQTSTGYATATATLADADGSFTATLTDAVNGGAVAFVYPATRHDGQGGFTTTGINQQDGSLDGAGGISAWDIATGSATLTISGTEATLGDAVSLNPQVAVFRLVLTDDEGSAVKADKLEVKVGGTLAYTVTPATATDILYVAMLPVTNADFTFTATKGNSTYTKTSSGKTVGKGYFYSGSLALADNAVDLSLVDCAGNKRASRWTANCYMVHKAGQYKLPLVYGNAVKAGQTNEVAYKPGGTTTDTYCANFVNHAGQPITAPWIKDNNITVASAELLWQDAQGLVTAVGIDGDYLTLTVGKDAAEQEGNAVVAAKDAQGTIVWSWHIWVTKQTFAASTLTAVNTGSHTYTLTPVNLGWVTTGGEGQQGYCPYYQWGRKDAFIPSTGTGNTNHAACSLNGDPRGLYHHTTNDATFALNIKNPMRFYNNNNRPYETGYYNLWDAQQTSDGDNISTATKKTVYDPCPAGFCVPTVNLYNYIGSNGNFPWDDTYKGRSLIVDDNSVFFPASGCRVNSSGSLNGVGSGGYYWSATPSSTYGGRYLYFGSGYTGWGNYGRAYGFSVRAVVEE